MDPLSRRRALNSVHPLEASMASARKVIPSNNDPHIKTIPAIPFKCNNVVQRTNSAQNRTEKAEVFLMEGSVTGSILKPTRP